MRIRILSWLTAAGVLAGMPAPSFAEFDPYEVPRNLFRKRVTTIALWPITLPSEFEERDELKAELEARLTRKLEGFGFEVVESDVVREVWTELSEKLGGVYDRHTGAEISEKHELAWEYLFQQLGASHGVNAVLEAWVSYNEINPIVGWSYRGMPYGNPITWGGENLGSSPAEQPLLLVGPSLNVTILDREHAKLYGVQMAIEWSAAYLASSRSVRDDTELLINPAHIDQAVDVTTGYLDPGSK